jgi:hypothetical protein
MRQRSSSHASGCARGGDRVNPGRSRNPSLSMLLTPADHHIPGRMWLPYRASSCALSIGLTASASQASQASSLNRPRGCCIFTSPILRAESPWTAGGVRHPHPSRFSGWAVPRLSASLLVPFGGPICFSSGTAWCGFAGFHCALPAAGFVVSWFWVSVSNLCQSA